MAGFCEYGNEPSVSIKFGEFSNRGPVSFSERILLHGVSKCKHLPSCNRFQGRVIRDFF